MTDPLPTIIDVRRELDPASAPGAPPAFRLMVRARRGDAVLFDRPDKRTRGRDPSDPPWSDGQRDVFAMFAPFPRSPCGGC